MLKYFSLGVWVLCVGCLLLSSNAIGQDITETNWYFGNSQEAILFDKSGRSARVVEDQAVPFGLRGSAVINDNQKGNLLFYSDGESIYDYSHQQVPSLGASRLNGDLFKLQPVVACPFPNNLDQYFFFTNSGASIDYTIVDASLQGNGPDPNIPYGDVTATMNQPTGVNDAGELMEILESADGQRFWLMTQDVNTLEFRLTEINGTGVATTTNFDVFPTALPPFEAISAAIKTDTSGVTIALAPKDPNRNAILLDFDDINGTLTFNQQVINTGFADGGNEVYYDLEWSNDGSKLYLSRTGDNTNSGNLYQIDFADTVSANPPVADVINYDFYRSYGLKRAIDGNIYHLYQLTDNSSPYQIGVINRPDSTVAANVLYDSLAFDEDFNGTRFPQFAPSYLPTNFFTMSFLHFDSCESYNTKFMALVDPLPQDYFWDFGDGAGGFGPSPIHTYQAPGTYSVNLTVRLNNTVQSIPQDIRIIPGDSAVDLGNDTTICVDETLILDAGQGVSYIWSTSETTQTIEVDTAGTYWVEVTGVSGCTTYDEIVVTEYGVQTQLFNQWYFGEQAGLDFNFTPPAAITDANLMDSPEGCASVSDVNGNLLFYTNGSTVWNKDHMVMANGDSLGGDSTATQSSLILPFADESTLFYIFTTEEVYGDFSYTLRMSIVDMKNDLARGSVIAKNIPIVECSSERITASGFNGSPWLLAHEYGNSNFRAYQINPNGVIGAFHSTAGEPHLFENESQAEGYMKFSPASNLVAVVIPGSPNYIDILDFDITNGEVSNGRLIDIQEATPAYGLEFSGDGLKLYITTSGPNSEIIQFDLDSINSENPETDIAATKYDGYPTTLPNYGALQRGPNGVIYAAIDNTTQLASINSPGGDDAAASFAESGADLMGRTSRLGLPNFTQQIGTAPQAPSMSIQIACAGQPTSFSGIGRDTSIEMYSWDFGDSTGVFPGQNVEHTYSTPGDYIVQLTLSNRCDVDSILTDTVTVFSIPQRPTVPTDTTLCGEPVTLFAWDMDDPTLNYYWSSGDTTRSVTFDSPTIVDVALISDNGCSSDTVTVFIGEDETFIDLGPDLIFCQNDTSVVLNANDPGPDFTWTREGVVVGDQQTQTIATGTPGQFTYAVSVVNSFSGCVYSDSVEVLIQPSPQTAQANIVNPDCGQATGSFQLQIDSAGSYSYELAGPVSAGPFTFDGPGTTPAFTSLPSGSYVATISNTVSGCVSTEVLLLEDNAPFEMTAQARNECVRSGDIVVQFSNQLPQRVELNILDQFGTNVYSAFENLTSRNIIINDLDSGTYFVEVRDANPPNCVQTDTVTLEVVPDCFRKIFVPNAFSPNGNGQNEEWFAFPNEFVEDFKVFVLNRWGDVVFYSEDKNFRWDGTFQNEPISPGAYAYRMLFTSSLEPEQGTLEQFGTVTVIK